MAAIEVQDSLAEGLVAPAGAPTPPGSGQIVDEASGASQSWWWTRFAAAHADTWPLTGLFVIAGLALFLYTWNLSQNGYGNTYYAAAVLSMTQSWKAFFFGTIDSVGFITVDKPPLALWVQALSARLFGFSSWSILLPQAVAGLATVLVLYQMARRVFGPLAATLAGLILVLTPITVAVARDNLPDTLLVLLLTGGAWGTFEAIRTGRLHPLLLGAALVGLAFNTKMLQAYVVVLGFVLTYLMLAPGSVRSRLGRLCAAGAVLAIVSASWMVVVDAIPADQRPYVGGSSDGTVLDLVLATTVGAASWAVAPPTWA